METTPATRPNDQRTQPPARCPGSSSEQTALRSCGTAADGFLRHRFMPLYEEAEGLPQDQDISKGVFGSLAMLSAEQGVELKDFSDKPYPYNLLLAHHDAQNQLSEKSDELELFIVQSESGRVQLAVRETVYTEMSLYYIPVLPLYRLISSRKHRESVDLLLSVFSYLYHVVGIPYYREEVSFLEYHYEMLSEWITDEFDEEEVENYHANLSDLKASVHFGDLMLRKMYSPYQLAHFEERLAKAKPKDELDRDCLNIARTAFYLWKAFPYGHLNQHATGDFPFDNYNGEEDEEDEWQENTVRMDEYVHFVAETKGHLWQCLNENVNAEFNERPYLQQPCLIRQYAKSQTPPAESLDFERRLFPLLTDLCTLLNQLP